MKLKILIKVSKAIDKDYFNDLKNVINAISKEDKIKNEIEFFIEYYNFKTDEGNQILNDPNAFLDIKYRELLKSNKNFNSIIYIPERTLNLKGNFLWYSSGGPQQSVMVFSSFLYKHLIEGKLNFGAYILLIYSQYLARFTVKLDKSHRESKNCLNDFCADQIEILNAFENKKDVLCNECLENKKNDEYYHIIYSLVRYINKKFYQKKKKIVKPKPVKPKREKIVELKKIKKEEEIQEINEEIKIETDSSEYVYYEYEIYVAKKCANIFELYNNLNDMLSDPESPIDGYSIYEVGGGWRDELPLNDSDPDKKNWKNLNKIKSDFKEKGIKDLIRPIFENENKDKKFALYDETSIVLRIGVKEDPDVPPLDESVSKVYREIKKIFKQISENENSIYFTLKKLKYSGPMEKKD